MKTLLILLSTLFSLQALANLNRTQAERLLQSRNIQLQSRESAGARLLLGEVTGAGFVIPVDKVELVIAHNRVILKKEIESMDFVPHTLKLTDLSSFRAHGVYFTKEDIQGALISR
jgi:hypothetical protein